MIYFSSKNNLVGIGLMTGTSCDGIDLALVQFDNPDSQNLKILDSRTLPYPSEISDFVNKLITEKIHISEISQFEFFLSELYAEAINEFLRLNKKLSFEIDFIAVHGQTIWHNPIKADFFGKQISSTLQSVNLSSLAKLTGIPVIGDFRSGDIALGGQGAPLVPRFDYDFFADSSVSRILLNIGGISNITFIPKGCSETSVIAFDCGPGNTLLDITCKKYFGKPFDENGEKARSGKINSEFLQLLLNDDFITAEPPKSTGREKFNERFLDILLEQLNHKPEPRVLMRTLAEFTAETIRTNIENYCDTNSEIIVSGGGRENTFLMRLIQEKLPNAKFRQIEEFGIPSDGKEAIAFAYLGWLFLKGKTGNIHSVTGASKGTILGTLAI
jgi:anhydro-N-acetylmuramic acid kinase